MSKTWKWILGILIVLIVVGAMAAAGFAWRSHMFYRTGDLPYAPGWNNMPMHNYNNWNSPMMNPRGFVPFGGFFVLGGLVKLALFFGLLYGAYWLGRRNAHIALDPKPAAPMQSALNEPAATKGGTPPAAPTRK